MATPVCIHYNVILLECSIHCIYVDFSKLNLGYVIKVFFMKCHKTFINYIIMNKINVSIHTTLFNIVSISLIQKEIHKMMSVLQSSLPSENKIPLRIFYLFSCQVLKYIFVYKGSCIISLISSFFIQRIVYNQSRFFIHYKKDRV